MSIQPTWSASQGLQSIWTILQAFIMNGPPRRAYSLSGPLYGPPTWLDRLVGPTTYPNIPECLGLQHKAGPLQPKHNFMLTYETDKHKYRTNKYHYYKMRIM